MVINGQTRMSGIWDWTQPCSYGRTCQPYWPLMLTDSWALTPRAVHCTERVSMKQEQQCSRRKVLVSLSEISIQLPFPCTSVFFACITFGNLPKWKSNLPKEHWQSAHGSGVAGAVILGMALLKTCPEQVLVIIASYPLLKKINALARNIVVRLCCALIWELCALVCWRLEDIKGQKKELYNELAYVWMWSKATLVYINVRAERHGIELDYQSVKDSCQQLALILTPSLQCEAEVLLSRLNVIEP